jgi:hypothetical protein
MEVVMSHVSRMRSRLSLAALTVVAGAFSGLTFSAAASAETFHVSNTAQLEAAVASANADASANTIELAGGEVYLPSKSLVFTDTSGVQTMTGPVGSLTIESPEAKLEGTGVKEVSGTSEDEVIAVKHGVTLDLVHVILTTGGREGSSAIEDLGTLNVEDSTVAGNLTTGILVHASAKASFTNSTISDGLSQGIADEGTATLLNDTVVRNAGSGIGGTGAGKLSLTNTVIAENGGPQCRANAISTNDHNLASDESCGAELKNMSPILSEFLENNGGSTTLHSELPGSPTIAHGDPANCPATDQRGFARPAMECDIGADQYSAAPPVIMVPEHMTVPATSSSGAKVTYKVEATDPDGLIAKLSCNPRSGTTFPVGTTTVTCTASDNHGNTASKSFEVTVSTEVHFENWLLKGSITVKKLKEAFALPAGCTFNGNALNPGALEANTSCPAFKATFKLLGLIPITLGLTFNESEPVKGTIAAGTTSGDVLVKATAKDNIGVTSFGLLGLTIPTSCKTAEPAVFALESEAPAAALSTGLTFSGETTIPKFNCTGGLLGPLFGTVLSQLASGPNNPFTFTIEP